MLRRVLIIAALLACASPLFAQAYKDARVLGGSTSFHKPALTNAASLKRMTEARGMSGDIRTVLQDAGIPEVSDAVLAVMSNASSAANVGSCSAAAPAEAQLVECQAQVGSTVEWMAYRPVVNGKRVPSRLERVRWAGKAAYSAFLFRVTVSNKRYTFIVPKPCGNLSLASVSETPRPAAAAAPPPQVVAAAPPPAAPPPPPPAPAPAPAPQAAPPPPAPAPAPAPAPPAPAEKPSPYFVDVLLGDEHRNRPADLIENKPNAFTQGSGLLGLKVGVEKRFDSNWAIAGGIGYGLMFLFKENTINQNPLFVDVEVNKHFQNRMFVGGVLSAWDITRGDTWTPAGGAHFGIPLGHHPKHPVYFLGEGRWFFNHRTHLDTHYLAWGGVRIHFG
jgi:hypothetical protein